MSHQTALLSSFEEYLANTDETKEELTEQLAVRDATLRAFPFGVILQVAYPEIDYANRWAWQQFGPRDGKCFDVRFGSKPSDSRCAMILNHTIIKEPGAATGLQKRITILASVNGTSQTRQTETVSSHSHRR
jgi:hypothetical protein